MREVQQLRSPLVYTHRFDPMPHEVDFTGYMSNTVATRWMETLRVSLMRHHFPDFDTGAPEHLSVISRTEIDYLGAIRYGEAVDGMAWVADVAIARWQIDFEFRNQPNGRVVIGGRQWGTFLNPASLRPVRVPTIIRTKYLQSLAE